MINLIRYIILITLFITIIFIFNVKISIAMERVSIEQVNAEIQKLNYKPSKKALNNISNYVSNSSSDKVLKGLRILLEPVLDEKLLKAQKNINNIKIDGNISDWVNTGLIINDDKNDMRAIDNSMPMDDPDLSDDIKSYAFTMDDNYIYCMFEPYKIPAEGETFHYRINFMTSNWKMIYAVIWTSWGNFIQEWDITDGQFINNLSNKEVIFASGEVFEVKIPRKLLPDLPEFFHTQPVVWHEHKNIVDVYTNQSMECSILKKYYKSSLEVFCRYAEKVEIIPDDPFPLAQAITEGYIYKIADDSIKDLVIDDGIEMTKQAKKSMEYNFPGQEPLSELSLEAILIWSNRAIIYGGYNMIGFYLTKNGTLNREGYEFMIMTPSTLDKSRYIINNNNLLDKNNLRNTVKNMETWLYKIIKYRRVHFEDIVEIYAFDEKTFKEVYEESLYEKNNNLINITQINGFDINKGDIFSTTFQVDYIYNNNFFYGNCVDVTAISVAFIKAIGIPSLHFCYGVISDKHYREIHSFPLYYSSEEDKWFNYTRSGNPLHRWATNKVPDFRVFFYINRPQIGSYWDIFTKVIEGNRIWLTSRLYYFIITKEKWEDINNNGYLMKDILEVMFKN